MGQEFNYTVLSLLFILHLCDDIAEGKRQSKVAIGGSRKLQRRGHKVGGGEGVKLFLWSIASP